MALPRTATARATASCPRRSMRSPTGRLSAPYSGSGTFWHLGKEVSAPVSGPVRPNEHPEINKPTPPPAKTKGEIADETERARLAGLQKAAEERERQAAIEVWEKKNAEKAGARSLNLRRERRRWFFGELFTAPLLIRLKLAAGEHVLGQLREGA